jgi:hypothetical protein
MGFMRFTAAAVLSAALAVGVSAQGGPEKAQAELDAAEVKGDKTAYARILVDDFTWVNRAGRLRDKKTVVDALQPVMGAPGKSVAIEVRPVPGGALMLFTRQDADGTEARVLRLWVQRGNQWLLAAHQGVPIGKPAPAATEPSSPPPPNAGSAAEIKAIEQVMAALGAGNSRGDAKNFGTSVTDGFVAINPIGNVASKQDRMAQLAKRPDAPLPAVQEATTRIYGDVAVTTQVVAAANGRNRQMIVHARQGGQWLRAAVISTAIATGK